ncbi:MAG: hypothetical protein AAGK04_12280 [Planctomycetota bacterium]
MDSGLHERLQSAAGSRTFRHLSEVTGVNAESVRRYMQGQAPSVAFVSAFCRELGVNADWLLTGRGPMRLADVKREALADADAGDLMGAVAGTLETLIDRVDRLDVFTQTLDVRLRAAPASQLEGLPAGGDGDPNAHDAHDVPAAKAGEFDRAQGGADGARAQRIGRAAAQRPRPSAD